MSTSLLLPILAVTLTFADQRPAHPRTGPPPAAIVAAIGDGWVSGTVTDESGRAVPDVDVLAAGDVVAAAVTDARGRFVLVLPVGQYVVRASRAGYVSTYKEPVRVQANRGVERRIRIYRDEDAQTATAPPTPPEAIDERHAHSEMAWRLRHLKRTVLRDIQAHAIFDDPAESKLVPPVHLSAPADRRAGERSPGIMSFLNLSGHVNLLTTSSLASVDATEESGWSQSVANVLLGAPAGSWGDWSVRGAMAAGDRSSWAVRGEYETRPGQKHEVRVAVAFRTLGFTTALPDTPPADILEAQRSGAFEAADRWHVRPALTLEYGMRVEHHGELPDAAFVSPHAGARWRMKPGTSLRFRISERATAPGIDDVLTVSESGPLLPAMRMYSLMPDTPLDPERTRRLAFGVDQSIGSRGAAVLTVEWFTESTDEQMATMFGTNGREAGGYYLARVGDVSIAGWRLGVTTPLARYAVGRLEYTTGRAHWQDVSGSQLFDRLAPQVTRRRLEDISDLKAMVNVEVPHTATDVGVAYQVNRLDPTGVAPEATALAEDRFDVKVRQRLPFRPLEAGLLHLLFTLSTLVHDDAESLYDEVLTVRAPARLTAGIQIGF